MKKVFWLKLLYIDEKAKIFILQLNEKMFSYNKHKDIVHQSPGVWHSLWTFPRITDVSIWPVQL